MHTCSLVPTRSLLYTPTATVCICRVPVVATSLIVPTVAHFKPGIPSLLLFHKSVWGHTSVEERRRHGECTNVIIETRTTVSLLRRHLCTSLTDASVSRLKISLHHSKMTSQRVEVSSDDDKNRHDQHH